MSSTAPKPVLKNPFDPPETVEFTCRYSGKPSRNYIYRHRVLTGNQ